MEQEQAKYYGVLLHLSKSGKAWTNLKFKFEYRVSQTKGNISSILTFHSVYISH